MLAPRVIALLRRIYPAIAFRYISLQRVAFRDNLRQYQFQCLLYESFLSSGELYAESAFRYTLRQKYNAVAALRLITFRQKHKAVAALRLITLRQKRLQ